MFSWYSNSSQQKGNKDKEQKSTDNLPLPLHTIGGSNGIGNTSNVRRLSNASASRVRFQPEGGETPNGGRSGRPSNEHEHDSRGLAPPRSGQATGSHTSSSPSREPETRDFDGLFDFRKSNPDDDEMAKLQAAVNSMSKDKPAFITAMTPNPELDVGEGNNLRRPPDNYYDPFSGELIARLQPLSDGRSSKEKGSTSATKDLAAAIDSYQSSTAIWSQLAKIRELQSEISNLHIQMEGFGIGGHHSHGRPFHRRNLSAVDLGVELSMMEELDTNADGLGLNALGADPEIDFEKLTGKLKGREEQINKIMSSLDDLSKAMADFHRIQMPSFETNSGQTRSNTVESEWSMSPQSHSPPAKSPLSHAWKQTPPIITPTSSTSGVPGRQAQTTASFTNSTQISGNRLGPPSSAMNGSATPTSNLAPISIPVPATFERPAALASKGPHPLMPPLPERTSSLPLHDSPQELGESKPLPKTS